MMDISRLLLTDVTLPSHHPRPGRACPVFGYLVHHPDGPVMVDTGVGLGQPYADEHFAPMHHPLDAALDAIGVAREDVVMVVNSHLHFDHCGQNVLFPGVPIVVQRTEREAAGRPGYTIPEWVDFPGARWQLVDGAAEILPGISVLPTPGHTAGHQSVVVGDETACDVIAAQAVYDPVELASGVSAEPLTAAEAAATSRSARDIRALRPRRVLFSHDPRTWRPGAVEPDGPGPRFSPR